MATNLKGDKDKTLTGLKLFDVLKAAPIARLGYHQYTHIDKVWEMIVPSMPDDNVSGTVLGGTGIAYADPEADEEEHEVIRGSRFP